MKLIPIFLCGLAILTCPLQAKAQNKVSFSFDFELTDTTPYARLDELAGSLLGDPYVLTQVKVTRSQLAILKMKQAGTQSLNIVIAGVASDESADEDTRTAFQKELQQHNPATPVMLELADLTPDQQTSTRKIALREHSVQALLTKEVIFALGLTQDQQDRLKAVRQSYWKHCGEIEAKYTKSDEILQSMKEFEKVDMNALTPEERVAQTKKMLNMMLNQLADTARKADPSLHQALVDSNKEAVKVLTAGQTAQLQKLQS